LTSAGAWRAPVHELLPIGPLRVKVKLPAELRSRTVRFLVRGGKEVSSLRDGWVCFEVKRLLDHEVAVIGPFSD